MEQTARERARVEKVERLLRGGPLAAFKTDEAVFVLRRPLRGKRYRVGFDDGASGASYVLSDSGAIMQFERLVRLFEEVEDPDFSEARLDRELDKVLLQWKNGEARRTDGILDQILAHLGL